MELSSILVIRVLIVVLIVVVGIVLLFKRR